MNLTLKQRDDSFEFLKYLMGNNPIDIQYKNLGHISYMNSGRWYVFIDGHDEKMQSFSDFSQAVDYLFFIRMTLIKSIE